MAAPNNFYGHPFPTFANEAAVKAFQDLSLSDDDVVMLSYPKAGTTWVNKILYMLLRTDENGAPLPDLPEVDLGESGQVYPDWLPVGGEPAAVGPGGFMGTYCFEDLLNQPTPRLFSTHVHADLLPEELKTKGRLVYVTRNPKDCLNSLHYFRGEAKDGWFGNEHGPGSFERFLAGVNAYGGHFDHAAAIEDYIEAHLGERGLVLHYEALKADIYSELQRIAAFLRVPLNATKLEVIRDATDIQTMRDKKDGLSRLLIRKGVTKDWENAPIPSEKWAEFDQRFEETLGSRPIGQPMRPYMLPSEPAAPEPEQ